MSPRSTISRASSGSRQLVASQGLSSPKLSLSAASLIATSPNRYLGFDPAFHKAGRARSRPREETMSFIGIDVSAKTLDVAVEGGATWQVTNDAAGMATLLASDDGRGITGQVISVDGGYKV